MSLLTASNIANHFGNRCLFSGLDFELLKDQRLAASGRNGWGMTTLLPDSRGKFLAADERLAHRRVRPPGPEGASGPHPLEGVERPCATKAAIAIA
ncbi:MAG: hypothetical protein IMW97_02775 [Firmicutes bacterium]|nr:hypothetical protein [Candidatus Fermentithermobacillaceae bacterium]